ncbi:MAG: N-acetylglucosamine-6-phosphate deacetylase [Clostridia bacterium]|jgi:N-acetylglucosamine-6-phosphate deacetylase
MGIVLYNGKVITPFRMMNGGVRLRGDKIDLVFEGPPPPKDEGDRFIDVEGRYIAPGFVDIHCHGGGGHDFMDGSAQAVLEGTRAHMAHGTTSILPTTVASTREEIYGVLQSYEEARKQSGDGPDLLGIHLEGPYFSMEQRGAQDPKYIRNPDPEEYLDILGMSKHIQRWTVAPELEGALEMGLELQKRHILPSIGHSNATYEQVLEAFEWGYTHVTHLYSGMSMVRRINAYRYAGVVESAYLLDDMTVEIIADGKHLPASLLKLIYKIKGADRICLVTDSMRAAGLPEGESVLGSLKKGERVIVEDGVAKLPDRTAFAGSVATADRLVRTMVELADVPLTEAVRMMTYTPARVIGEERRKGSLAAGKDGDVVVFDEGIQIRMVIVKGDIRVDGLGASSM